MGSRPREPPPHNSKRTESGSSYENEYFGIHYDLPEGWTFEDDATLAESNSQSDAIASDTSIDMVAYSPDKSGTVTIGIEGATEYNAGQSAEEHLANQVKEMVESAEGDNVSYLSETATLTFDGSDTSIPATATTLTVNGNELHVLNAVLENEGNFLSFVVQAPSEEEANAAAAGLRLILE